MKNKVFVVEPCKFDLTPLARHGTIVYVFPNNYRKTSLYVAEFRHELIAELAAKGYVPSTDYLAVVGPVGLIAVTLATILAAFGNVRLLLYNRGADKATNTDAMYLPLEFNSNAPISAEDTRAHALAVE